MDINSTIASLAASNPIVGRAVAMQSTDAAILAGAATGDTSVGGLLGALFSQESEQAQLLASVQPNLGQNISTLA
jgi:hypothetical protein